MYEFRLLVIFESLFKDFVSFLCCVCDRKSKILYRVKRVCSGCGNIKRCNKGGICEGRKKKGFEVGDINVECMNRNVKNSVY